jgi:ADP-ribose pyrophosphatase YjhB (NUDIX family)
MKHFFVGVKAVIVRDDKVLLVRGDAPRDFWDTPGGRVDDDENIMQTLDRELHEELPNITNYTMNRLVHAERIHRDVEGELSLVLLFYLVEAEFDGEPQISEEHTEIRWIPLEEARKIATSSVIAALGKLT